MITKETATGLVFNKNREILMIKHKLFDKWLMPGGKLKAGETPHQAAIREVFEETGIEVAIVPLNNHFLNPDEGVYELPRPFCVWNFQWEDNNQIDHVYACRVVGGELRADPEEIAEIGWFNAREIRDMDSFNNVKVVIDRFLETYDI